jgi:YCII-related domain
MAAASEAERRARTGDDGDEGLDEGPDAGPDAVDAWIDDLGDRRLYGWPLELPDRAVTVRRVDDGIVTTDGPFAETKEQIAGYDLLECSDLDEAIAAAAAHPVAGGGVIELRPLRAS